MSMGTVLSAEFIVNQQGRFWAASHTKLRSAHCGTITFSYANAHIVDKMVDVAMLQGERVNGSISVAAVSLLIS